jgi:hypothetical protein
MRAFWQRYLRPIAEPGEDVEDGVEEGCKRVKLK